MNIHHWRHQTMTLSALSLPGGCRGMPCCSSVRQRGPTADDRLYLTAYVEFGPGLKPHQKHKDKSCLNSRNFVPHWFRKKMVKSHIISLHCTFNCKKECPNICINTNSHCCWLKTVLLKSDLSYLHFTLCIRLLGSEVSTAAGKKNDHTRNSYEKKYASIHALR